MTRDDSPPREPMWRRYLRFHRADPVADLDDELHDHLASTEEALIARGVSPQDARDEAHRRFGDVSRVRTEVIRIDHSHLSRTRIMATLEAFAQDLRYAARVFRRSPVFTVVAALSIALAVAANTTIFSVVNAILLRPIPGTAADNLVRVYVNHHSAFDWHDFQWFRERTSSFDQMVGERNGAMSLGAAGDEMQRVRTSTVTRGYFGALGVRFALGRGFDSNDSVATSDALVAVMSHRFWQERFGGDSTIVGRRVTLAGQPVTVVGVAEPEFRGSVTGWAPELFVPLSATPLLTGVPLAELGGSFYTTARLARGVSRDEASAQLGTLMFQLARTDSARYERRTVRLDHVRGVNAELRVPAAGAAVFAMAMVGMVLLIACANVASLLMARAAGRQTEIGVRLAIGASRGRILRQLLTESLLLALVATAVGLGVSLLLTRLLGASIPAAAGVDATFFAPDHRVLAFTAALCVGTTLLFGLAPALRAARPAVVPMLKGTNGDHGRRRSRGGLVAVQSALCVILLAVGSLFGRSLQHIREHNPGFRSDNILDMSLDLRLLATDGEAEQATFDRILREVRAMPDVDAATLAALVPLSGSNMETRVAPEGLTVASRFDLPSTHFNIVTDGYFETLAIPLARGRGFLPTDRATTAQVAVVNETAARAWWSGADGDVIGKRFRFGGAEGVLVEVVGVARDADYNMPGESRLPFVYRPLAQQQRSDMVLQLHTTTPLPIMRTRLWETVRAMAPALPPPPIATMSDDVGLTMIPVRVGAIVLGTLGAVALLLAATGIYGVTAYAAARRTREIGIRAALGATRTRLLRMMVMASLAPVTRGAIVGLVLAMLAGFGLGKVLYGVRAFDPIALPGVVLIIALVALVASLVPARAAARVDPVVAMRAE